MQQETAFDIMKTGHNVFLTGSAGTGKTHVIKQYIRYLHERNVNVAVTASTGIAATHIAWQTIHSWSGLGIKDSLSETDIYNIAKRKKVRSRIEEVKVLIIDEISMLSGKSLQCIDEILRYFKVSPEPFWGIQVILTGDFFQLPPVTRWNISSEEKFAFMAPIWVRSCFHVCYLTQQYRQDDDKLLTLLWSMRSWGMEEPLVDDLYEKLHEQGHVDDSEITKLYTHNIDVDRINSQELARIEEEEEHFFAEMHGDKTILESIKKSVLAPDKLILKLYARVMFVRNNYEAGYLNGTLWVIIGFDSVGDPVVRTTEGREIAVSKEDWIIENEVHEPIASYSQIPLRLAWAITVHKSQGMTLDSAYIDLSKAFEPWQWYVALSRVRNWEGLHLLGCNQMALRVDPLVSKADIRFKDLSKKDEEWIKNLDKEELTWAQENFIMQSGGTNDLDVISTNQKKIDEPKLIKKPQKKWATITQTYKLLADGKSLDEIVMERWLTLNTIVTHIEKLVHMHDDLHIDLPLPDDESLLEIIETIEEILDSKSKDLISDDNQVKLWALHHALGGRYSYDQLRIVRLYQSMEIRS